jgi:hypothetical protein
MTTYDTAAAASAPATGPVRARLQPHLTGVYTGAYETLELRSGDEVVGVCVLPRDAAYDVVSRLEDTPATVTAVDQLIAGQVRHVLETDYRGTDDVPDNWTTDLIMLIRDAPEEEQRRLGRIYPAYMVAIAIGTGPGGLEALRRWHAGLPPAVAPDTYQDS